MRIGDVAKEVGTTTRTIRYYEEIGLLPESGERPAGGHRVYTEADVDRLREIVRLKEVLNLSLDELKTLVEAEDARALLRDEWHHGEPDADRRRVILDEAKGHIDRQLALVRARRDELDRLEADLVERRKRNRALAREFGA
jgi:MerR family transcriptional regulator, repressor of the yfmOP operon